MEFVHLHLHSQYSLLDGAIRFEELFPLLDRYGMKAVALTDHGNMFGAVEFYKGAKDHGIKPILGCELYVAPKGRKERDGDPFHLILLVEDAEGYRNLSRLVSLGYLEGFYQKPRIDRELLERHHRGLIAMTSCLKGEIPLLLSAGRYDEARARAGYFKELFGDRFYLELQDNGLEEQKRVNEGLLRLARDLGLKVVASNDCHYLRRTDALLHDVLLCIQTGKRLDDPKRLRFSSDQFHLRPPEEMQILFKDVPEALKNTLEVAERCHLDLQFGQYHLPQFDPPGGASLEDHLRELATHGLRKRLVEKRVADAEPYWRRLAEELQVINSMGFAGYFLIVADFVNYARSRGIPVGPGRGSAAGSLVAYSLGITDIDPLEHGLLFERFLNPERVTPPDIDVDFCYEGRDEVIRYVMDKYGHDRVAQIITFGKMQARAVVRDVGRVLGMPYREVDLIAKLIPAGPNVTLEEALEVEPRLREMASRDGKVAQLLEFARRLEGMVRHASTHAAGVVIANRPLMEYLPLYRAPGGEVTTQFAMKDVERIGLVKFDFLGLKTLTMMKRVVELVAKRKREEVRLEGLPLDDPQTYRLLSEGDTTGVFQLESQGMRELLRKLKPSEFRDLVALLALYRPGPLGSGMVEEFIKRRHKRGQIRYPHPALKEVLEETYGVIVYQEQVMMAASLLADFSLGEADLLRRAMGKKDPQEMAGLRERFIQGAVKKGLDRRKASEIFDLMAKFAEYGFNKSHSAAYAMVAYQTAYLKAHYPEEFMAALLTSDMDNSDKVMRYIAECREKGIEVLPPDVNHSSWEFTVEGNSPPKIRYGLGAVKNVGRQAVEAIIEARGEGPFQDLFDFCRRVDTKRVNRRAIESLIKAGAFASTGAHRSQLMAALPEAMEGASRGSKKGRKQPTLFGLEAPSCNLPEVEEWPEGQILQAEKEALGFYFTSHPLKRFQGRLEEMAPTGIDALVDLSSGERVKVAGVVVEAREIRTRKGDRMAVLQLEDLKGRVEVVVFPELFRTSRPLLGDEQPLVVEGVLEKDDEGRPRLRAQAIAPLQGKPRPKEVHIKVKAKGLTRDHLEALKQIMEANPGPCVAFLHLLSPEKEVVLQLPPSLTLSGSEEMVRELEGFLGYKAVEVE